MSWMGCFGLFMGRSGVWGSGMRFALRRMKSPGRIQDLIMERALSGETLGNMPKKRKIRGGESGEGELFFCQRSVRSGACEKSAVMPSGGWVRAFW